MKRLNFVVSEEVYHRLEGLKEKTKSRSMTEVFEKSLDTYDWVAEEVMKGREVVSRPKKLDRGERAYKRVE